MYPAAFEYHAPATVKDALKLLGKLDDAKILAGGHSLVPMMKLRLAQPKNIIDLRKVTGLTGIKEEKGFITVGAMTTHWEVESSKALKSKAVVVSETAAVIGDPAVRNKGTIGGSLAHADPAADMPATAIALGFEFVCEGPKAKRTVKVDDWFTGLMEDRDQGRRAADAGAHSRVAGRQRSGLSQVPAPGLALRGGGRVRGGDARQDRHLHQGRAWA